LTTRKRILTHLIFTSNRQQIMKHQIKSPSCISKTNNWQIQKPLDLIMNLKEQVSINVSLCLLTNLKKFQIVCFGTMEPCFKMNYLWMTLNWQKICVHAVEVLVVFNLKTIKTNSKWEIKFLNIRCSLQKLMKIINAWYKK